MIRKKDGCNIVLAGLWNRAIFTPEWVSRLLFNQPEVETLLSVMPHMPIIYRNKQVSMEIAPSRLAFKPRSMRDESLRVAERMAHTVLKTLQDTPLLGVGINFAFTDEDARRDLVQLFDFGDGPTLSSNGWDTETRRIMRRLKNGDDMLNLVLTLEGSRLDVEFNFHTDTTDNALSQAAVADRIVRLRNAAHKLLASTYDLTVENEEEDHG